MKLFGVELGKEKAVGFPAFRDLVRLAVRRQHPNCTVENTETGLRLTIDGKRQDANLRNLYMEYTKTPKNRESQIQRWIMSLIVDIPEHGWSEAQITLRPTLKHLNDYIAVAQATMQKAAVPDSLPHTAFLGDLGVIVMRDLPGTAVAVTQVNLDSWGVTFDEAMQAALMNMNMLPFPNVSSALVAGGSAKKGDNEEVGLVLEGDHLTATWLLIERFRDYITQRLQGDYVAFVPVRSRMVVVRADEPGLIGQMQQSNRSYNNQNYSLTPQGYHVNGVTTGGIVSIYQSSGLAGDRVALDQTSIFAHGNSMTLSPGGIQPQAGAGYTKPAPVDLSSWGGLQESTGPEAERVKTPYDRAKR